MAALIDFDREYMRFAAAKLAGKGELKDNALEKALNDSMKEWLSQKADWLGGLTPDEYFEAMSPEELTSLMAQYCEKGMNVPEPLYRRIADRAECAESLASLAKDESARTDARATALRLLCDMNAEETTDLCVEMVANGTALSEMAAEWLANAGYGVVEKLLSRYEDASDSAQEAMLDILCYYPGIERTAEILRQKLLSGHDMRAQHAALAARLGDSALIEPLQRLSQLSEMTYYDYKEIINAIDALGGETGEERQFYGDPDYELMRDPDISLPEDWRNQE